MFKKIIVITFLLVIYLFNNCSVEAMRVSRSYSEQDRCFNISRAICGAIEMYNMDVTDEKKISSINQESINILTDKGYIRKGTIREKSNYHKCEYAIKGDVRKDVIVYCKYHGSPEYGGKYVVPPSAAYMQEIQKREFKRKLEYFYYIMAILAVISILAVVIVPQKKGSK